MRIFTLIIFICTSLIINAQMGPGNDWFHANPATDNINGIATDQTYNTLLKDRPSKTVIVAIIDSGVDIEHEDLKDNIWVNAGEIPSNGIDDDKNGYIDDVNGWNFIGGKNGENVGPDTYEVTRLYKKLDYRYKNADSEKLNKKQAVEYEHYLKYKDEVDKKKSSAENNYNRTIQNESFLMDAIKALDEALAEKAITIENVRALQSSEQSIMIAKNISENYMAEGDTLENLNFIEEDIKTQLQGAKDHYGNQMKYAYNLDFNSRLIVGDNYSDSSEKYYGNNDVEGPDAMHGTHVAGIVGAVRNNQIGMNGVADNVKIMSVRTVPDGDERDKDVANAIIYAVDNGAEIINMSFGKGFSWDKGVVDNAIRYARKKDVLLVHAAGNSAQNNDFTDNFPNKHYEKKKLFGKRSADNWLEIGALSFEKGENLAASFSNYGKSQVDIFAPGVEIYSTLPNNRYENLQGTSMASPVVAGVAAVLRSYFPTLSASQVREVILMSAQVTDIKVKKPGSDEMVNFSDLSRTGGFINLEEAVKIASKTKGKKKVKTKKANVNKV